MTGPTLAAHRGMRHLATARGGNLLRGTLFATTALIAIGTAPAAHAETFVVSNYDALVAAINSANEIAGADTIVLGASITLEGLLPQITGATAVTSSDDNVFQIDGASRFRLFFVDAPAGTAVSFTNLNLTGGVAEGGAGGVGGGGGGLGAGGAIFVNSGAVSVTGVSLAGSAYGGGGGRANNDTGTAGGGGGLGGGGGSGSDGAGGGGGYSGGGGGGGGFDGNDGGVGGAGPGGAGGAGGFGGDDSAGEAGENGGAGGDGINEAGGGGGGGGLGGGAGAAITDPSAGGAGGGGGGGYVAASGGSGGAANAAGGNATAIGGGGGGAGFLGGAGGDGADFGGGGASYNGIGGAGGFGGGGGGSGNSNGIGGTGGFGGGGGAGFTDGGLGGFGGGAGAPGQSGGGGAGLGGAIFVRPGGNATLTIDLSGDKSISGNAFSGAGGDFVAPSGLGAGGALFLAAGDTTITVSGSSVATIDGSTADGSVQFGDAEADTAAAANLIKTGAGTLVLNSENTFTGTTTIVDGTLQLGSKNTFASVLESSSAVSLTGATAVLDASQPFFARPTINNLSGVAGSQVLLGSKGLTVNNAANTEFAGTLVAVNDVESSSTLSKTGEGTLTLTGSSTLPAVTVLNGTLEIAAPNTFSSVTGQQTGVIAVTGAGTLLGDPYVGLFDTAALDLVEADAATIAIGRLQGSAQTEIRLGATTLEVTGGAVQDRYDGVISGTGGLTVSGGTLSLAGINTYSGATTIGAAAQLNLTQSEGDGDGGDIVDGSIAASSGVQADGILSIAGLATGTSIRSLSGDTTGQVLLGGNDLTISNAAGTFAGVISDQIDDGSDEGTTISAGAGVTIAGGTQVFSGDNTYTGTTTLDGGNLTLGTNGTTGSVAGPIALTAGTLTINRSDAVAIAQVLAGAGNLVQAGSGTTTLSAANAYTGTTTVSGGTLALAAGGSITPSRVIANAAFDISAAGDQAIVGLTGGAAGTVALGANTLSVTNAAGDFAGAIGGTGGFTVAGGAQTLSGTNTYTGATTISGGSLTLASANAVATSAVALSASGAQLIVTAPSAASVAGLSGVAGSGVVLTSGGLAVNQAAASTFAGVISGAGGAGLSKDGTGTLTLSGTNTFTGPVNVVAGVLSLANGAALADTSGVTLAANGTLNLTANETIGSLAGTGATTLGANTLTLATGGTYGGVASGTGGITIAAGNQVFTGNNTYTGATTLGGGNLTLGNGGTTGAVAGPIALGSGLLTINRSNAVALTGAISGSGGLTQAGTGTTTLSGANTFTGPVTVDAGVLLLTASMALPDTSAVTVNANGTLALGANETIGSLAGTGATTLGANTLTLATGGTYGGVASGTGGITIAAGNQVLTGNNTYTGTTTLGGGNLTLGNGGTTGAVAGPIALGSGLLTTNRSNAVALTGAISGSGGLTQAGTGTTTLSGTNTFTGPVLVNAGTLAVAGGNAIADSTVVTVASGATFAVGGAETVANLAGNGAIALAAGGTLTFGANNQATSLSGVSGAGGLTKVGTGAFTLAGANQATGLLTLAAGRTTLNTASYAGGVTLASGATLAGTGSTGALTIANGATLNPGATDGAFGTITAASLTTGGTVRIDFGGNSTGSASDKIIVTGAINVTGGAIDARPTSATNDYTFNQYFALTAGTTFTGRFTNATEFVQNQYDPRLRQRIRYDLGQSAVLEVRFLQDLTLTLPASVSDNATAVALSLNGSQQGAGDTFATFINGLADQGGAARAQSLAELSGEGSVSGAAGVSNYFDAFLNLVGGRTGTIGAGASEGSATSQAATGKLGQLTMMLRESNAVRAGAELGAASTLDNDQPVLSGWLQGFGVSQTIDASDAGRARSRTRGGGIAGGIEAAQGDNLLGVALSYGNPDTRVRALRARTEGDAYAAALYGRSVRGPLTLAGTLGASRTDLDLRRNVVVGPITYAPRGETRASNYGANLSASYGFDVGGGAQLAPLVSATYQHQKVRGYIETGGGAANLAFARDKLDRLTVETALAATRTWITDSGMTITPTVRGGYAFVSGDKTLTSVGQFVGAPVGTGSFVVGGAPLPSGWGTAGIGLDIGGKTSPLSASLDYEGGFGSRYEDHRIGGTVRYRF